MSYSAGDWKGSCGLDKLEIEGGQRHWNNCSSLFRQFAFSRNEDIIITRQDTDGSQLLRPPNGNLIEMVFKSFDGKY